MRAIWKGVITFGLVNVPIKVYSATEDHDVSLHLSALPEERSREIDVVDFVPSDQIDPIIFDRSYFLEPEKAAVKAYALLRRTLEESDRTAIVRGS